MLKLVVQENGQEYGDADVSDTGTVPVDFRTCKGRIILAGRDNNTEDESQNRPEREERCLIGQDGQVLVLCLESAAEAVVANSDADPCNKACHAADVDEPIIGLAFTDERCQESCQTEYGRSEKGV